MESTFFGGAEQTFTQDFFGWIVGELKIMYTSVNAGITSGTGVNLSHDCQTWMKIGKTAGRQRTATSCELQKCFSLISVHVHQHVDESKEAGAKIKVRNVNAMSTKSADDSLTCPCCIPIWVPCSSSALRVSIRDVAHRKSSCELLRAKMLPACSMRTLHKSLCGRR